jgi:hypothetical protein
VRSIFALAASVFLVGCPGPTFIVQQYPGEVREQDTIAILRSNAKDEAKLLLLDETDVAAPIAEDGRLHIEMLPGRHTVMVTHGSERSPNLPFDAVANHVYRVVFANGDAHVYEVDRSSDKLLNDVTIVAAPPPPAPPLPPPPEPAPAP